MKFWIKKENDADPDVEWKDSYILTLNRDSSSTIYSGLPSIWYHLGCQKMVPIYEDLFVIGLSVFALDKRIRLVDLGCYFSINTNMVKGSKKENYHLLPLERILIESDGPYTKVNNKKYTPALLKDAYEEISRFYNNPDLPRKIYYNFKKILLS